MYIKVHFKFKIHWMNEREMSSENTELKHSRSGFVAIIVNVINLLEASNFAMTSPENNPGHWTTAPF